MALASPLRLVGVEHQKAGIVALDDPRAQDPFVDPPRERLQGLGCGPYPLHQSVRGQRHALAGKDLRLTIDGLVILVLQDHDVREEARLGQPAVDHPRRHLGSHRLREATATAIYLGHVADDDEARGDVVEALRDLLADPLFRLLTALAHAFALGERVPPLLAGQVRRQGSPTGVGLWRRLRWRRPWSGSVGGRFGLALVLLRKLLLAELLERLTQRVRVDLL